MLQLYSPLMEISRTKTEASAQIHNLENLRCSFTKYITAKNTVISPTFLVWKVCGKTEFPQIFWQFAWNSVEMVPSLTRKLSKTTVFLAVHEKVLNQLIRMRNQ